MTSPLASGNASVGGGGGGRGGGGWAVAGAGASAGAPGERRGTGPRPGRSNKGRRGPPALPAALPAALRQQPAKPMPRSVPSGPRAPGFRPERRPVGPPASARRRVSSSALPNFIYLCYLFFKRQPLLFRWRWGLWGFEGEKAGAP